MANLDLTYDPFESESIDWEDLLRTYSLEAQTEFFRTMPQYNRWAEAQAGRRYREQTGAAAESLKASRISALDQLGQISKAKSKAGFAGSGREQEIGAQYKASLESATFGSRSAARKALIAGKKRIVGEREQHVTDLWGQYEQFLKGGPDRAWGYEDLTPEQEEFMYEGYQKLQADIEAGEASWYCEENPNDPNCIFQSPSGHSGWVHESYFDELGVTPEDFGYQSDPAHVGYYIEEGLGSKYMPLSAFHFSTSSGETFYDNPWEEVEPLFQGYCEMNPDSPQCQGIAGTPFEQYCNENPSAPMCG